MTKTINLYTDGSCLGNPGPGGWGYVLEWGDYRIFGGDGMTNTTNNRQELYAVIHGLEQIKLFFNIENEPTLTLKMHPLGPSITEK